MNWRHRLGIACLVIGSLIGGATWGTAINHAKSPVQISKLGLTPEGAEETRQFVAGLPSLQIVGADSDADNRSKRVVLTGALYAANGNQWPWHGPQQTGDCASFAAARAIEIDQAVQLQNGAEIQWRPVDRPWLYCGGRFRDGRIKMRGEGAVPAWIKDHVETRGVLWSDEQGLEPYSAQRANRWGSMPPIPEWVEKAAPYKVKHAFAVGSAQEVCNALNAGYPVMFGSMKWGINNRDTKGIVLVEGRNVARDGADWPHAECFVGYDGTTNRYGAKGLWRIDNSWGPEAHEPKSIMPEDAPGGYYAVEADVESICHEKMCFAISETEATPKRDLNFDVFKAVGAAAPPNQGDWIMFEIDPITGYGICVVLMAIGLVLLVLGNVRRQIGLAIGLAVAMFPAVTNAADLDFTVLTAKSTVTAIDSMTTDSASECPLNFACLSIAPTDPDDCPLKFHMLTARPACNCTEDGICTCGPDCACVGKKKAKTDPALAKALKSIADRLDRIEESTKPKLSVRLAPEPAKKLEQRRTSSYPVRTSPTWWKWSAGVSGRDEKIHHLATGEHAGKFPREWLAGLTDPELESVHSDDHDGRLQRQFIPVATSRSKPPVNPLLSEEIKQSLAPNESIVPLHGKLAKYRTDVGQRKQQVCNGRSCSWKTVPTISHTFMGYVNQ